MKKLTILFSLTLSTYISSIEPYPVDYWAVGDGLNDVQVSLEGKYLSFEKIPSKTSPREVHILEVDNLSKPPFVLGGEKMDVENYYWVSDEHMVVIFSQKVRQGIQGFNQGVFSYKAALLNLKTQKFKELDNDRAVGSGKRFSTRVVDVLPSRKDEIIISYAEAQRGQSFKGAAYYIYNFITDKKRLILRGNDEYYGIRFDENAKPIRASGFDAGSDEYIWYYRPKGSNTWTEYHRMHEDSFETFNVVNTNNMEGDIYVIANNGEDKESLWKYNLEKKKFTSKVYGSNESDLFGALYHFNTNKYPRELIGVSTYTDRFKRLYLGGDLSLDVEALYYQLEQIIPNSYQVSIVSSSYDNNTYIVRNTAPNDPGTYYLIHNNTFTKVGSKKPFLEPENLASLEYIKYPSSDGLEIPAYVHVPKGKGPFPLVVMPHGGPFVGEYITYDTWPQFFANNGYMVIQPIYRGSFGYGIDFHKAAFINGGQGGLLMQDDADWGVKHLIDEGRVDPDNVYMFGWSNGGYYASIAATNKNNLYKCVIAGAPVTDLAQQGSYYLNRIRGAQEIRQKGYYDGSISPIEVVSEVKVPVLIVHGDKDQRVPVKHAYKYAEELKKYNKKHKLIVLEGADHFSNTLTYDHYMTLYNGMLDFINNDCQN